MYRILTLPIILWFTALPIVDSASPGTFFWKPRLGIDLTNPRASGLQIWQLVKEKAYAKFHQNLESLKASLITAEADIVDMDVVRVAIDDWPQRLRADIIKRVTNPTVYNMRAGFVVMIDGFQAGMTVTAIAFYFDQTPVFKHLNPKSAYYYTNAYRWALRFFSLFPTWFSGRTDEKFCDTHKVWRKRFFYMDKFVPKSLRKLLPFIKEKEWKQEEREFKIYSKYAEPAFGKHYHYPKRVFDYWASEWTVETIENLDE